MAGTGVRDPDCLDLTGSGNAVGACCGYSNISGQGLEVPLGHVGLGFRLHLRDQWRALDPMNWSLGLSRDWDLWDVGGP